MNRYYYYYNHVLIQSSKRLWHESKQLTMEFWYKRPKTLHETRLLLQELSIQQQREREQQQQQQQQQQQSSSSIVPLAMYPLLLEKEWVFLKYEGLGKYLQKKLFASGKLGPYSWGRPSQSPQQQQQQDLTTMGTTTTTRTTTTTTKKEELTTTTNHRHHHKVAFMITRQQKHILSRELNYTDLQIKRMTPTDAMLIIEYMIYMDDEEEEEDQYGDDKDGSHGENGGTRSSTAISNTSIGTSPSSWKSKLEEVRLQYQMQQEQEQQQSQQEQEQQQSQEQEQMLVADAASLASSTENTRTTLGNTPHKTTTQQKEDGESTSEQGKEEWYEVVVRMRSDGTNTSFLEEEETVVALYKTKREAQEFVDIKTELRDKRTMKQHQSNEYPASNNRHHHEMKKDTITNNGDATIPSSSCTIKGGSSNQVLIVEEYMIRKREAT